MSLNDLAIVDANQFTTDTDSGFGVDFIMYQADLTEVALRGTTARHHTGYDTDGVRISSSNAHVAVSEIEMTSKGIVVRNAKGNVDLLRRRVRVPDSSGQQREYIVDEQFPDESIGIVVLALTDYEV